MNTSVSAHRLPRGVRIVDPAAVAVRGAAPPLLRDERLPPPLPDPDLGDPPRLNVLLVWSRWLRLLRPGNLRSSPASARREVFALRLSTEIGDRLLRDSSSVHLVSVIGKEYEREPTCTTRS